MRPFLALLWLIMQAAHAALNPLTAASHSRCRRLPRQYCPLFQKVEDKLSVTQNKCALHSFVEENKSMKS